MTQTHEHKGNAKKVLIVEDDNFLASALTEKLRRDGYQTVVVRDGNDGLKEANWSKPDLILLDIKLPTLDGFEFLEHYKKSSDITNTAMVIVFTNSGDIDDRHKALKLGAYDFLVKADTSLKALHDLVDRALETK